MAGINTPSLAAAVSNAGGVGGYNLSAYSPEHAVNHIREIRSLSKFPVNFNFFCFPDEKPTEKSVQDWKAFLDPHFKKQSSSAPKAITRSFHSFIDSEAYVELMCREKIQIASFHFGIPTETQMETLKKHNVFTMATVTSLPEAKLAADCGIEALVAQGVEAGGHRGIWNPSHEPAMTTRDLVRVLKAYTRLPVVAAGGVMNGRDALEMLELGASGVQMGTAFLPCKEALTSEEHRRLLLDPSEQATYITSSISGRPARALVNKWAYEVDVPGRPNPPPYPYTYSIGKELAATAKAQGDLGYGVYWAGSEVRRIRPFESAAELVHTVASEMGYVVKKN